MKLTLNDPEVDDFELIGIQTQLSTEYQFVYLLNQFTSKNFIRIDDLDVKIEDQIQCFSMFHFFNQDTEEEIYLIKNQSHFKEIPQTQSLFKTLPTSAYLLPKHTNFTYLCKIYTELTDYDSFQLSLIKIPFIQSVQPLENLNQKDKNKLIF